MAFSVLKMLLALCPILSSDHRLDSLQNKSAALQPTVSNDIWGTVSSKKKKEKKVVVA
jgi:hypothetical protein